MLCEPVRATPCVCRPALHVGHPTFRGLFLWLAGLACEPQDPPISPPPSAKLLDVRLPSPLLRWVLEIRIWDLIHGQEPLYSAITLVQLVLLRRLSLCSASLGFTMQP